jgi:hypothetical protein
MRPAAISRARRTMTGDESTLPPVFTLGHYPGENEEPKTGWIDLSSGIVIETKSWMYHIFHDAFCQYGVNCSINPTVSDAIWIQMTFIPEELGIKSSNQANFLECFDRCRLSNRCIRAVSDPAISILAAVKIL